MTEVSLDNKTLIEVEESNQIVTNESGILGNNSDPFILISSESPSCRPQPSVSDQHIPDEYLVQILERTTSIRITNEYTFIIDSGATSHMTPNEHCLIDFQTISGFVYLGNNNKLEIIGTGDTNISVINNILLVPELVFGLISIPKLDEYGCVTVIDSGKVIVRNSDGDVVLTGTLRNNLYYLDRIYLDVLYNGDKVFMSRDKALAHRLYTPEQIREMIFYETDDDEPNIKPVENEIPISITQDKEFIKGKAPLKPSSTIVGLNPLEVLHNIYGHLSEKNILRALRLNMIKGSKVSYEEAKKMKIRLCVDCMKGRMRAFKTGSSTSDHEFNPLEKVCVDFKGYFPKASVGGYRGFILFSDQATNYVYTALVKSKGDSVDAMNEFNFNVVMPNNKTWKILQADYDTIFKNTSMQEWLNEHGMVLQLSAPYVHSQNGQVERSMQNVMDKARTLMAVYNTPSKYWGFAVTTACYLINRSPTSISDKTPHEAVTGEVPDISNLVSFYAPGVYHLTYEERRGQSWLPKSQLCRMLGYSKEVKLGYIVLNVRTGKVIVRTDCIFDETVPSYIDEEIVDEEEEEEEEEELVYISSGEEDEMEVTAAVFLDEPVIDDKYSLPYIPIVETANTVSELRRCKNDICYAVHDVIALPPNPASVQEALAGPDRVHWLKAINDELQNFDDRHTFAEAPQTGRAMKTKMILKYMYKNDMTIKYKARLVACGYSQIYGVDYKETYSPTPSLVAVFILLHLAAMCDLHTATFDVSAAFLEGKNDYEMYCRLPKDLTPIGEQPLRLRVVGNFYGEKQGPKLWNDHLDKILVSLGFTRCAVMPCLYYLFDGMNFVLILVHVDDGLMVSNISSLLDEFMSLFLKRVQKAELLHDYKKYIGISITRKPETKHIILDQCHYIEEHFDEYKKKEVIPMSNTMNLRTAIPCSNNNSLLPCTGMLRYLADRTRPDILVATGEISTGGAVDPSDDHIKTAIKTMNYLSTTSDLCLKLGGEGDLTLFAYVDASYITDGNAKSRLGGCVFMGYDSGAVASFSRNDTIVSSLSHSSTEAEIRAIDLLLRDLIHILDICSSINLNYQSAVIVYCDNNSAILLCETLKSTHRTKHINMIINFIREKINERIIELHFVPSEYNVADILTKPLAKDLFLRHRDILMNGHKGNNPSSTINSANAFVVSHIDFVDV